MRGENRTSEGFLSEVGGGLPPATADGRSADPAAETRMAGKT